MDELLIFFTESNISLTREQTMVLNRLTENLRNVVKANSDKSDELIVRSKESDELTRFAASVFHTNKKTMSRFVWKTLIMGVIGGARRNREY